MCPMLGFLKKTNEKLRNIILEEQLPGTVASVGFCMKRKGSNARERLGSYLTVCTIYVPSKECEWRNI